MTELFLLVLLRSAKAALLILGIFLLRRGFGERLSPRFRHGIWILVPLLLFLAVTIPLPFEAPAWRETAAVSGQASPPVKTHENHENPLRPEPLSVTESLTFEAETEAAAPEIAAFLPDFGRPQTPLALLWLLGTFSMATLFLFQTLRCRSWLREARPVTDESTLQLFEDCRRKIGVRSWVVLAESPEVSAPLLLGVIRPRILFPAGLVESLPPENLRHVFLHELAHLRRGDLWTGWLMSLTLAVHWFNPLLWLATARMNADREEACDAMALDVLDATARIGYGNTLLDMGERLAHIPRGLPAGALAGIFENPSTLKRRIEMIRHPLARSPFWTRVFLVLLLLGMTALMGEAKTKKPVPETETATAGTSPVDEFDKDDPSALFDSAPKPLKPGKYTGAEAARIGKQVFEQVTETNRHWLYAPKWDAKRWTYTFEARNEAGEKMEKPLKLDREDPNASSAWTDIRGISLITVPQGLCDFMSSSESTLSVKNVEITKTQIKLHFQFSGDDSAYQMAGLGLGGSFFGFVSAKATEGMLYVDPKDYTLVGVKLASGGSEKYTDYVALDEAHKVPRRIEVEFVSGNRKTNFDFRFKAYEPGIWLFDRGECRQNGKKGSQALLHDVTVNGSAPVEIRPAKKP